MLSRKIAARWWMAVKAGRHWRLSEGSISLPEAAKSYITALEAMVGAPMGIISTSPEREDTIVRK